MLNKDQFMPLNYFKKISYYGSITGLRFKLGKEEVEEEKTVLRALIWPGPFCLEKTDLEKTYYKDFEFTKAGIDEAVDYINSEYTKKKEYWDGIPFWTPEMSITD